MVGLLLVGCGTDELPAHLPGPTCPERMAHLSDVGVCIDRHEAVIVDGRARPAEGRLPTNEVSWFDSDSACRRAGFRLCSFEEFLRACSGSAGDDGRVYPYGDEYEHERCNSAQDGTSVVGRELATGGSRDRCVTPEGVYDLSGNLGEWLATADGTGTLRQLIGGSYANYQRPSQCTTEHPAYGPPEDAFDGQGFRCCTDAR